MKVIMKVWKNRAKNQKLVTVPKDCDIEEGDYVEIIKREFKESIPNHIKKVNKLKGGKRKKNEK
ncbi:hypothetical protein ES705_50584 [subsurface metagenome]